MITSNPVVSVKNAEDQATVQSEIRHIRKELLRGFETPYGALLTPSSTATLSEVQNLAEKLQQYDPRLLLLVGIGGSNMGTLAVLEALGTKDRSLEFLCADTIDEHYTSELLAQFRRVLTSGQRVILCIVTKSGTTAETIINGSLFLQVLKEFYPREYHKYVVIITDEGSPLYAKAKKEKFELLTIPSCVGGRYSVFSAAGLFPLMMLGVDVNLLCAGAERALRSGLDESLEINETACNALTLFAHYKEGYTVHNLFAFSPYLVSLSLWYKQLIGESLGKKESTQGRTIEVGFTPVVSVGTTDLHSVAQQYLAGPRILFTTFLSFDDEPDHLMIPNNELTALIQGMAELSVTSVRSAIFEGTVAAFKKQDRPSLVISLEHTPESIGAFLISKMIETILLGRLLDINAFDQPAVELYKKETRDILSRLEKKMPS